MTCTLEQHICDPYVTYSYLLQTHTPFVALAADQSVVQWAFQFIVSSKHSNCTTEILVFTYCVHVSQCWRSCVTLKGDSDN